MKNTSLNDRVTAVAGVILFLLVLVAIKLNSSDIGETHEWIASAGVIISLLFSIFSMRDQEEQQKENLKRESLNLALNQLDSAINRIVLFDQSSGAFVPYSSGEAAITMNWHHLQGQLGGVTAFYLDYQYFNSIIVALYSIQDKYIQQEEKWREELQLFYHRYWRVAHEIRQTLLWVQKFQPNVFNTVEAYKLLPVIEEFIQKKEGF